MSFVFEGLLGGTITLAVIYLVLIIYVYSKLLWLQSNTPQGLNTRKLFVMSILLTCLLRFMSFASMTLLTLGSVHFQLESGGIKTDDNDDDGGDGTNKEFFAKASVVLFDFPDFCFVSAYVLLLIVWAETYLKSRRHWLSSVRFQQVWIWSYLIFNLVLYTTQTALYSLLFIPTIDEYVQTNLIYLTLAGFNLFLPICWIIVYLYMSILFAGFPYASRAATRRLSQLSYLGCVWTTTRLGWGLIALTSVLQHWITEARRSTTFYTCTLVLIFLFTEVLPIMVSLQKRVLQSLSEQDEGARGSSRSSAGVGGDRSSSGGGIRYSHIVPAEEEEVYSPSRTSFTIPPAADPAYQPPPSRSSESLTRQSERPTMWHGGWWHLDSDNESVEKGPSTAASPSASPSLWDRLKGLW